MPKIVIGLVGPIASGKGTVVEVLKKKGFAAYSLSDRIREEIKTRGEEGTRDALNKVSNELRHDFGADILAKRTTEIIERDNQNYVVIDAIRNPAEVNYLKQKFNARIVGVIAPQEKRFEFFVSRGSNIAGTETWEQFKELDDSELSQEGEHKQQVEACLDLADVIIDNNGTIEELKRKAEVALADLKK